MKFVRQAENFPEDQKSSEDIPNTLKNELKMTLEFSNDYKSKTRRLFGPKQFEKLQFQSEKILMSSVASFLSFNAEKYLR